MAALERLIPSGAALAREARSAAAPPAWNLDVLSGRLVEVSGDVAGAPLTFVFRLVLEAQRRGEPAAWVGRRDSIFYPPDAADIGVDLASLPVIWSKDTISAAGAADLLIRSGAFGLVVLDLGAAARLPVAAQTRLAGLAQQHDAALLCITEKDGERPSLGSLVSLRAQITRVQRLDDRFSCVAQVIKDKRRGPGWQHVEVCRGPDGLH